MPITPLPTFTANGRQERPTAEKINEIIEAVNSGGGGGGGDPDWGDIGGTLSAQTDLQNALDGKAASSHNHSGANITSGTVPFAQLPTGTGGSQVAVGNHSHTADSILPAQTGNNGKVLKTNGTTATWQDDATGGGGGGASFPMAEGVWYDTGTLTGGLRFSDEFNLDSTDDQIYGCLVRINDPAVTGITKIGVPVECDAGGGPYTLRAAIYAPDANGLPAGRIGSATTISVAGDAEDVLEGTFGTPITVASGDVVWLIVSGGDAFGADATMIRSAFDAKFGFDDSLTPATVAGPFGVTVSGVTIGSTYTPFISGVVTGAGDAMPSDLTAALSTGDLSTYGANILFQITHD